MNPDWIKGMLRWLYPPRCPVCGDVVDIRWEDCRNKNGHKEEMLVCTDCRDVFRRVRPPVCYRCGGPVEQEEALCFQCRGKRFSYIQGFPIWVYHQPVRRSIAAFKYHGRQEYAAYYAEEFARIYGKALKERHIQALIPVPMYPAKQRIRGYNQAALFAQEIGKRLGIAVCGDYLLRIKDTVPQKDLGDGQRYMNLQNAFAIDRKKRKYYAGLKNIVLADDIYTTGSTAQMCTRVLMQAGVKNVYLACVSIGSRQ